VDEGTKAIYQKGLKVYMMKSAVFDPGEYSFLELAMANKKSAYNVAYDKWIAIYGAHVANLFSAYGMTHGGESMPVDIMKKVVEEAEYVANLAVGLRSV
jgi:hypothetical protein